MLSSNQVVAFVLFDVVVIVIVAWLLAGVFQRFGQPRVLGEIVAGVLLGPTLLGASTLVWHNSPAFLGCDTALAESTVEPSITACLFPPQALTALGFLGQLGLAFFMLLVGLEVNRGHLRGHRAQIAGLSASVIAIPVLFGFLVGPVLYNADFVFGYGTPGQPSRSGFSLMIGTMLAVTAFPVLVRILQERRLTESTFGTVATGVAAGATILTFTMLENAVAITSGRSFGRIVFTWASVAALIAGLVFVVRPLLDGFRQRTRDPERFDSLSFVVVICLTLAVAALSAALGLTVIVGAFAVGLILPVRRNVLAGMRSRIGDITLIVLIPVFLAYAGLQTDFTEVEPGMVAGIALLTVAAVASKWLGAVIPARLAGFQWQEANALATLFNCRGFLVIVVALVGRTNGLITQQLLVTAVVVSLVTTLMTGPLFNRFSPALERTVDSE